MESIPAAAHRSRGRLATTGRERFAQPDVN
jgi:hypothetical protein